MPYPTNHLFIEFPTDKGIRRSRYLVTFRPSEAKISFRDKGKEGIDFHVRKRGNHMICDPTVSKEDFKDFVKEYIAERVNCWIHQVKLSWERWMPLWGEDQQ